MRKFRQIVDDGTSLAAGAQVSFPTIERAMQETIQAAAMIAVEGCIGRNSQTFSCEVQDADSLEHMAATVRLIVDCD